MNEVKRYTLEEKPDFKDQQSVKVDMASLGCDEAIMEGKIVGKAMTHIIDYWLVEFPHHFPSYPFRVLSIPHVSIVKE